MSKPYDPRDEAEQARAALKANAELGLAMPESPMEQKPSVTPATFGEESGFKDEPGRPPTPNASENNDTGR